MKHTPRTCPITGIRYNDSSICIKGLSTYACVCPKCEKEFMDKIEIIGKEINQEDK